MAGVYTPVHAQSTPALCRPHQNDHVAQPAPDALLPRLARTFAMPATDLRGASYVRCAGGQLMGCITGANLNCGHANISRRSDGGDQFCRESPNAEIVPLAATGHDTIYDWRCIGTHAVAGQSVEAVDRLGFMTRNWRPVR